MWCSGGSALTLLVSSWHPLNILGFTEVLFIVTNQSAARVLICHGTNFSCHQLHEQEMKKSFCSYRSDLCVEGNICAKLCKCNLLAKMSRVVHMQIYEHVYPQDDLRALRFPQLTLETGSRTVSKLSQSLWYSSYIHTFQGKTQMS